jgi:hypothetical protein
MKKFAAVLFVLFAVVSNVAIANDKEECHPEKEHCEHH